MFLSSAHGSACSVGREVLHHQTGTRKSKGRAFLGALRELTELWSDAPLGWAVRCCAALERVSAIRPRVANLLSLRNWTRLRMLVLMNAGVGSLDGLEALTALEVCVRRCSTAIMCQPFTDFPG